jgi:hypothetical protein
MRRTELLALLAAAACSEGRLEVPLPDLPAHGALILLIADQTSLELDAYDLETIGSAGLPHVPRLTETTELDALVFSGGLTSLGLTAGPFQPGPGGIPLLSLTPTVAVTATLTVARGFSGWSAIVRPSSVLASVRVPGDTRKPCETFAVTQMVIDNGDGVGTLAVPIDDTTILYATGNHHFFEITKGLAKALPATTSTLPSAGGFRDDSGTLWLFGDFGQVAQGTLQHGFKPMPSSVGGGPIRWAVGRGSGDAITVYALTDHGTLTKLSSGAWSLIAEENDSTFNHGLVAVWPDDVYTVSGVNPTVFHYKRDISTTEDPHASYPFYALNLIPGIGVVAAESFDGRLFATMPGRGWTPLEGGDDPQRLSVAPYDLAPIGRAGLLVAGALGAATQYFAAYGFCSPGMQKYTASPIRFVRNAGEDLVLFPDDVDQEGRIVISWLTKI